MRLQVANNRVMLVDHADAALAPRDLQCDTPLMVRVEAVGSTATLIVDLYREAGKDIPKPLACELMAAVVGD